MKSFNWQQFKSEDYRIFSEHDFFNYYTHLLVIREENEAIRVFEQNMIKIRTEHLTEVLTGIGTVSIELNTDPIQYDDILSYVTTLIKGFTITE